MSESIITQTVRRGNMLEDVRTRVLIAYVGAAAIVALLISIY